MSNPDLKEAGSMLQDFVVLVGILCVPMQSTMNIHLLQHLAHYVSHRGRLWTYSCFAFESMNAFIKLFEHGPHHAMELIGCALGLRFGLSYFTKKKTQNTDIPRDSEIVLRSLTGYSKSCNKMSAKVNRGQLSRKEVRMSTAIYRPWRWQTMVMANKSPADYEHEPYCRFDSNDGQKFNSLGV